MIINSWTDSRESANGILKAGNSKSLVCERRGSKVSVELRKDHHPCSFIGPLYYRIEQVRAFGIWAWMLQPLLRSDRLLSGPRSRGPSPPKSSGKIASFVEEWQL